MAGNETLRALFGQWLPQTIYFSEVEGGVTDGQSMNLVGIVGGEVAGVYAPYAGRILGLFAGSEASASFGITPAIGGVDAAAAYDIAVTGLAQGSFYATPLAFAKGDLLGVNFDGTVNTAKDVNAQLYVAYDLSGG